MSENPQDVWTVQRVIEQMVGSASPRSRSFIPMVDSEGCVYIAGYAGMGEYTAVKPKADLASVITAMIDSGELQISASPSRSIQVIDAEGRGVMTGGLHELTDASRKLTLPVQT